MRILLFGTYDTAMHPRIAAIAEGLAASGLNVAECNAPLDLSTADRVAMLAKPHIGIPAMAGRLASRWTALAVRAARLPVPDAVVVGYLGHFDVHLARLVFGVRGALAGRRVPVVLDHLVNASDTGKDRRLDGGPRQALLSLIDAAALRAADVIVVDTEEHREKIPARRRPHAIVVPVGAPEPWYAAGAQRDGQQQDEPGQDNAGSRGASASQRLSVVFFGLYTPLQGTPVIGEALGKLSAGGAPVDVTMIGSGQDEAAARSAAAGSPHVTWRDWVPAAELPAVVAAHDVCLGIFGTGDKARRVVPNKVFQGAAAGCAIITSDTPPQRRVLGDAAILVPPGDPGALAGALLELAGDPARVARLRAAARELAVTRYSPGQVVAPLVQRLRQPAALRSPAGARG